MCPTPATSSGWNSILKPVTNRLAIDWVARKARRKDVAPAAVLADVRAKLKALLVI